jgi:hypothetical protein
MIKVLSAIMLFITTAAALADPGVPATVTLPSTDLSAAVNFLRKGGPRDVADYIADKLVEAATADFGKQRQAAADAIAKRNALVPGPTAAPTPTATAPAAPEPSNADPVIP